MAAYIVIFLGAVLVSLLATPLVTRLATAMRIMDRPTARKVHTTAVPRVGGAAVIVSLLAVIVPLLAFQDFHWPVLRTVQIHFSLMRHQVIVLLSASAFIFLVGLVDDFRPLPAKVKLLAQLAAAVAVCALGIRIGPVGISRWFETRLELLSWPVTILWIVGITNAVNLIDGLDGLAAGICAIACAVIAVFSFHLGQVVMGVLMLGMLGSLTGFLFFNFNPARIFLGDCGSMFLGFFLATASVMSATKSYTLVSLALPALALGLPIFDTLFTMLRRTLERRSMFSPDRSHIHHRLVDMGLHQRHAVILMYVVTFLAAGTGMFMMITRNMASVFVFAGALVPVLLIFRVIGALRVREAITAIQLNRVIARETRAEQRVFERLRVQLGRASDLRHWWKALRRAARGLGFARLAIQMENRDGTVREMVWRLPDRQSGRAATVSLTLPIRQRRAGEPVRAEVDVPTHGTLESAGRRVALFARLLDLHPLAGVPSTARPAKFLPAETQPQAQPGAEGVWVSDLIPPKPAPEPTRNST